MEELEHGVLRVRAGAAPGDRCRRLVDRRAVEPHRLAVRFHFELLEIGREQPQPLVIGEDAARLTAEAAHVEPVHEGGEQRRVLRRFGIAEMPIQFRRPFEKLLERAPAQGDRGRHSDRAPQRIAAADAFGELQDAGLVHARLDRRFGARRHRDHPAVGIGYAGAAQPVERRAHVGHGLGGRERLGRDDDQSSGGIEGSDRIVEGLAVDVRQEADIELRRAPPERIHEQGGAQDRPPNPDVEHARDVAKRSSLDGVDERSGAGAPVGGELHGAGRSRPPLGDMLRRAPLGRVDRLAGEQGLARGIEPGGRGHTGETVDELAVEMRLRPVEGDSVQVQGEDGEAIRLALEQGLEPLYLMRVDRAPVVVACHCRAS